VHDGKQAVENILRIRRLRYDVWATDADVDTERDTSVKYCFEIKIHKNSH